MYPNPMLATVLLATALAQSPYDALLNSSELNGAIVSAIVTKTDGTVVYERDSARRVMPGSNQKLLSTTFAMHRLGAGFIPKTRFWKEPERIVVDAPGDPMMTAAELQSIRTKLGLTGITPIFVRQGYRPMYGPNWELGDLPEYYAAAVTAFTVDRGVFKVWGSKGQVEPIPDYADVQLRTYPGPVLRLEYSPITKLLTVRGLPSEERKEIGTCALPEPDRSAARILGGPLFSTDTLPRRNPDFIHTSKALKEIVAECLTISDNLIAENLLLMATQQGKEPAENPYPLAQAELKKFLVETVGWDANDVRPDDGSGMSRHNSLTVRGIARLLAWTPKQPWFAEWKAGLAVPGKGTLRTRLEGSRFQGKTGTLDMVSALSGYVVNKDGETMIVSIVFNHYACPSAKAREIADKFVKTVEGTGTSGTNNASLWSGCVPSFRLAASRF